MRTPDLMPCPCCGKKDQIKIEDGWKRGKCERCGFYCSVPHGNRRVNDADRKDC